MLELCEQVRLLLWRNFIMKKRNPFSTLSEIVLPILFIWLLITLRKLDKDVEMESMNYTCPRQSPLSPSLFLPEDQSKDNFLIELSTTGYGPGIQTLPPLYYLGLLSYKLESVIALAPGGSDYLNEKKEWLEKFEKHLDDLTKGFDSWGKIRNITGFNFCRFKSFSKIYNSSNDLSNYIKSEKYGTTKWPKKNKNNSCPVASKLANPRIHLALILNKVGSKDGDWKYTIRANITSVPFTFPKLGFTNPISRGVNEVPTDQYLKSGFSTLQNSFDRFLINQKVNDKEKVTELVNRQICDMIVPLFPYLDRIFPHNKTNSPFLINILHLLNVSDIIPNNMTTFFPLINIFDSLNVTRHKLHDNCIPWVGKMLNFFEKDFGIELSPLIEPASMIPNNIRFTEFPTEEYVDRPFYEAIKDVFGLDLILTFLWPVSRLIRGIVVEKETKLREGMKMMGLIYSSLYISWLLTYSIIFFIISVIITIMSHGVLFTNSNPMLVFLLFFLFGLSMITYCFLVSVIFNRAKTASTAGVVMFFMGFIPYFGVSSKNASSYAKMMGSILSPTGFGIGGSILATYEGGGEGVTFDNFKITK